MRTWTVRMIIVLLACLIATAAAAEPASGWEWRHPAPQADRLWAVAYGGGVFVAVGDHGAVLASPDGSFWRPLPSGTTADLYAVTHDGAQFVAGGDEGTVLTSGDGLRWAPQPAVTAPDGHKLGIRGLAAGDGLLAAAGIAGDVAVSTDAATWEVRRPGQRNDLLDMLYAGGKFVAVGWQGTVLASTDGHNWQEATVEGAGHLAKIAWGNGKYVALSDGIYASADGVAWTKVDPALFRALAFSDGRFIALTGPAGAAVSDDGVTWAARSDPQPYWWRDLACGGGTCVAVGENGLIGTSADGLHWTVAPDLRTQLNGVVYGDGRYVAVGESGWVLTSATGRHWDKQTQIPGTVRLTSVAFGDGLFVAAGEGVIAASSDGVDWAVQRRSGLWRVKFLTDHFLAWNLEGGRQLTSPDGKNWSEPQGPPCSLVDIAANRRVTVALCEWGAIYTATAEGDWTRQADAVPPNRWNGYFGAIAYGNDQFVILEGTYPEAPWTDVRTSSDGLTWTRKPVSSRPGVGLVFGVGVFVAATHDGVLRSADGQDWTFEPVRGGMLRAVTYGPGQFVAVGDGGAVLTSTWPHPPGCEERFSDLSAANPACAAIAVLASRGVIDGTPGGLFLPDRPLTRAEAAKLILLALEQAPAPGAPTPFSDVAGHWAGTAGYIQGAAACGISQGYPDGTFRPDRMVTRAELVKMVAAAAGLRAKPAAGEWYTGWVDIAGKAGLIGSGAPYPLWQDDPDHWYWPATRGEAAMLLANLP